MMHGSYRGANLDEVAVRVIKPDYPLSPAVRHQAIDIFNVRVESFPLFYDDKGSFEFHGLLFLPIPAPYIPCCYSIPVLMKWPS